MAECLSEGVGVGATRSTWFVSEDGCLLIKDELESVVYHQSLNVILVTTRTGEVRVIDVMSGAILHSATLSGLFLAHFK